MKLDLNETEKRTIKKLKQLEPSWHWCDVVVRHDGKEDKFQADWMRQILKQIEF